MNLKVKKLRKFILSKEIDAFLITEKINISYLLDHPCSDSWLLITSKKIFYITDTRYAEEIRKKLKKLHVWQHKHGLERSVIDIAKLYNLRKIGFNAKHLDVFRFKRVSNLLKKHTIIDFGEIVEDIRSVKTREEISNIQKAINIHLKCFGYLRRIIRPGLSERQILKKLQYYVLDQEVHFSFRPIIASGFNSSFPHACVTDRRLRVNDILLVDFGIEYKGYKSDLTRMFFLGKISQQIKEIYSFVDEAQRLAINNIRPGQKASFIDQQARNFLKSNKLDKFFVHALGHGIGLQIHEKPAISSKTKSILEEGMVFTIEPGVYFPGKFGIRKEDMVLVTADGCKRLSF